MHPRIRRPVVVAIAASASLGWFVATASSGWPSSASAAPPGSTPSSVKAPPFTPIVARVVTPPTPLPGSDDRTHLAYELLLTNLSPRQAELTSLTVRSDSGRRRVLGTVTTTGLTDRTILAGDLSLAATRTVPSYATADVVMDTVVPEGGAVPAGLAITLQATFAPPAAGQPPYVSIFPDQVREQLPLVPVRTTTVRAIAPPLSGGDWLSTNACCTLNAHGGTLIGGGGRTVAPERYAIDFSRIDLAGKTGYSGQPPSLANNLSYGAKLLAVANATVVAVSDDLPDQAPFTFPTGYTLNQMSGNHIILKLAPKVYALYAHIEPGKVMVRVGQRVHTGQVLGLLGNSGNSSGPHLHFHLMDGPSPLTADGLPYVFTSFTVLALPNAAEDDLVPLHPSVTRHDAYPLALSLIGFPGSAGAPAGSPIPSGPLPSVPNSGPDA